MIKEKNSFNKHITRDYIAKLYREQQSCNSIEPIFQILGFQESTLGNQSQIIIRLSDATVFLDCILIGPYSLKKDTIICQQYGQMMVFTKFDIVKLSDHFSKIDLKRICKLRIIVRRMQLVEKFMVRDSRPQEVGQYFRNLAQATDYERNYPKNSRVEQQKYVIPEKTNQLLDVGRNINNYELVRKQNKKKVKDIIKIQDDIHNHISSVPSKVQVAKDVKDVKEMQVEKQAVENKKNQEKQTDHILTTSQVMQGKQGYFIGRLLRMKLGCRETKDGPINVLALGFIDKKKQLLRVNLAGRLALKQMKQLRKGRCYHVKGFDFYKSQKMLHSQLKIRQKQCQIYQVPEQTKSQKYAYSFYHWDHQNNQVDTESVDVIGIIDGIEEKATYPQTGNQIRQNRQVIRVVVRNTIKSVKISFWAEQIQSLMALQLKRYQEVMFEDIKKKKNMFLDFTVQSNLIRLSQNQALKKQFSYLIPEHQEEQKPTSLRELRHLYERYPDSTTTRIFTLYLIGIQQNKIIYKICSNCKKKVQKELQECSQCKIKEFNYKFNCQAQFTDFTGSISCVLFDQIASKLFGKSASEIHDLDEEQLKQMIDQCLYQQYQIGIQNKNLRLIARSYSSEPIQPMITRNLQQIRSIIKK